jgi:hypothetical protein
MIGKSLRERYGGRSVLPETESVALLTELLPSQAEYLVQVRANDANMIACLIVRADDGAVRMCRMFGFEMKPGGTGVFGLAGPDTARAFPELAPHQRAWLAAPCGPRETKVLLVATGIGLLSLETVDGKVTITAIANASA